MQATDIDIYRNEIRKTNATVVRAGAARWGPAGGGRIPGLRGREGLAWGKKEGGRSEGWVGRKSAGGRERGIDQRRVRSGRINAEERSG